jgi:hypothetical protein
LRYHGKEEFELLVRWTMTWAGIGGRRRPVYRAAGL